MRPSPEPMDKLRTIDFLVDINQQVCADISYLIRLEPGVQTPEETLETRQRFVPRFGVAALPDPAASRSRGAFRQRLPDPAQAGREVARRPERARSRISPTCTRGARCICRARAGSGFDPTSGLLAGEGHIPLAATPDPQSAAPYHGARGQMRGRSSSTRCRSRASTNRRASRSLTPTSNGRRSTRSARRSTRISQRGDVRLTMGGEPTFVSHRRHGRRGVELHRRRTDEAHALRRADQAPARASSRPAACCIYGQGKWYPGEPLPRWALGCYWRRTACRSGRTTRSSPTNRGTTATAPRRRGVSRSRSRPRSAWNPSGSCPAYEDVYYYLWKERRLPSNVDPLKSNLKDKEERARHRADFPAGARQRRRLRAAAETRAEEGRTALAERARGSCATRQLCLIPGDSPMGLRLPLDSLPWVAETRLSVDPIPRIR